jgi:hypothetical protein
MTVESSVLAQTVEQEALTRRLPSATWPATAAPDHEHGAARPGWFRIYGASARPCDYQEVAGGVHQLVRAARQDGGGRGRR